MPFHQGKQFGGIMGSLSGVRAQSRPLSAIRDNLFGNIAAQFNVSRGGSAGSFANRSLMAGLGSLFASTNLPRPGGLSPIGAPGILGRFAGGLPPMGTAGTLGRFSRGVFGAF